MPNQFNTSLWGDEGFSAILSMKPLPEIIRIIATDTSPPLWNIWEWLAFQIFGTSEIVIRGLAFTFFLGAIFFTYKIGELLWGRHTGLLAAALTFLNPFFFIYAFEGRMYSILALGVTASMYFFLKILNTKNKKLKTSDKVGYVIATLWAMYSHHFAIFALFLQGLWFLKEFFWGKRDIALSMLKPFIAVGVLYLPWVIPLYNQTKMVGGGFWLGTPTFADLINLIRDYLAEGIKHNLAQTALYLVMAILALRRWKKDFDKTAFLLAWFLGPIVLTWLVSQTFQSIFFNRYLLYAIPGVMLVLASNGRRFSGVIVGILLIVFGVIDFNYFTHPTKRPFRELAAYVKETRQEGDFLINWNAASHHLWETKYYGIPAPIYISGGGELPFFVGTALMEESDVIQKIPERARRVGIVTSSSVNDTTLPGYTLDVAKSFRAVAPQGAEINFVWYTPTQSR